MIKAKRECVNEALIAALHANSNKSWYFDNWDNVLKMSEMNFSINSLDNQVKKNTIVCGRGSKI